MGHEAGLLFSAALVIGSVHTLLGPDHYLPFIVLAKAQQWSLSKTTLVTVLCGLGHVLSSVVLGLIGAAIGIALTRLEWFEGIRGELAGWALLAFGLVYTIYGVRAAVRNRPHTHLHFHSDGTHHAHTHAHQGEHAHPHEEEQISPAQADAPDSAKFNPVPWFLFIVFILGPCEPLIPLLMYPAMEHSYLLMLSVALVFSVVTICTMLAVVLISVAGLRLIPTGRLERYSHLAAGLAILLSGVAIKFMGL